MLKEKYRKIYRSFESGFTLVEVLVSIAIFLIAMMVVVQLLIYSMRSHRKILARVQTVGEVSYNLEHISRGLRMAKKSEDDQCLSAPNLNYEIIPTMKVGSITMNNVLVFLNRNSAGVLECVGLYSYHPEDYPPGVTALMEYRKYPGKQFNLPLTSPDTNVLDFSITEDANSGWAQTDDLQPRVTLFIRTQDKEGGIFETQTTISQRDLDVTEGG